MLSANIYNDLQDVGTAWTPATSCKDLKTLQPHRTSGWYVIRNTLGQVSDQYCNMDLVGCGRVGGWMRVANLDMTQPNQQCPPGFRTITASGKRLYVADQGLLAVCLSSSPQTMTLTTELVDESSPTKIRLLMPSVHTLAGLLTKIFAH